MEVTMTFLARLVRLWLSTMPPLNTPGNGSVALMMVDVPEHSRWAVMTSPPIQVILMLHRYSLDGIQLNNNTSFLTKSTHGMRPEQNVSRMEAGWSRWEHRRNSTAFWDMEMLRVIIRGFGPMVCFNKPLQGITLTLRQSALRLLIIA